MNVIWIKAGSIGRIFKTTKSIIVMEPPGHQHNGHDLFAETPRGHERFFGLVQKPRVLRGRRYGQQLRPSRRPNPSSYGSPILWL
jgi:hypothetical protein